MTHVPSYTCDHCGIEDLRDDEVSEIPVRAPPVHDPVAHRPPKEATLHFCDECGDDLPSGPWHIDWVALDRDEDGVSRFEAVGVQHRVARGMQSDRVSVWDARDSVVLGSWWEDFFDLVERSMEGKYL